MTKLVFIFPVYRAAPLCCVWFETGNPAQPLACRWMAARELGARLAAHEADEPEGCRLCA